MYNGTWNKVGENVEEGGALWTTWSILFFILRTTEGFEKALLDQAHWV